MYGRIALLFEEMKWVVCACLFLKRSLYIATTGILQVSLCLPSTPPGRFLIVRLSTVLFAALVSLTEAIYRARYTSLGCRTGGSIGFTITSAYLTPVLPSPAAQARKR